MYEYYLFTDFYHTTLLPPNLPMCVIHLSTVIVDTSSEEITSKRSSTVLTIFDNSLVLCVSTFCALFLLGIIQVRLFYIDTIDDTVVVIFNYMRAITISLRSILLTITQKDKLCKVDELCFSYQYSLIILNQYAQSFLSDNRMYI